MVLEWQSHSIRETFQDLLRSNEGVFGTIDTDEFEDCMLLSDPTIRLHVCRYLGYNINAPFGVDEFVEILRFVSAPGYQPGPLDQF